MRSKVILFGSFVKSRGYCGGQDRDCANVFVKLLDWSHPLLYWKGNFVHAISISHLQGGAKSPRLATIAALGEYMRHPSPSWREKRMIRGCSISPPFALKEEVFVSCQRKLNLRQQARTERSTPGLFRKSFSPLFVFFVHGHVCTAHTLLHSQNLTAQQLQLRNEQKRRVYLSILRSHRTLHTCTYDARETPIAL